MFSSVLVTAPDLATAQRISRRLVEMRLAACANYWSIGSMFRWEGEVHCASEYAILLKVRNEDYPLLEKEVATIHPYDVPCIVRYDIAEGFSPYMKWVNESTERRSSD